MWCIDSQLFFHSGDQGLANITLLNKLPTAEARYGQINSSSGPDPHWTNSFGPAYDPALVRFQMAAWLVQQYVPFPSGPTPSADLQDLAIQRAIWAIMHNTTSTADWAGYSAIDSNATPENGAAHWVDKAKAVYGDGSIDLTVDLTRWAVVTWVVNLDGTLHADDRQTFLVQVTPEPGFYAILGFGLGALFLLKRRHVAGIS
jgi:hypothetical protein